jgi:NO-binding membrane sensor protein with MHYT domain
VASERANRFARAPGAIIPDPLRTSMNEHVAEFSLLLSLLGMGVTMLAAQVSLSWVRQAQRGTRPWRHWRALLMAALALGTGLGASAVLTMSAEGLPFSLGYHAGGATALWLLTVAACVLPLGLLAWKIHSAVLLASGALLALAVLLAQMGWVYAAGLVPGVTWRWHHVGLAAVILTAGISSAWWLWVAGFVKTGSRRALMHAGAVLLLGMAVVGGQELLILAAGLSEQKRAEHAYDLNAVLLSLFSGVLVPLVLTMLALDVSLRGSRRGRRESHHDFTPVARRRRRERPRSA